MTRTQAFTEEQIERRRAVRAFVARRVASEAGQWARERGVPAGVVREVGERGWLGASVPAAAGGLGWDRVSEGLLHEEIGRGCSSLRSLLTVHGMVIEAIGRWGGEEMRQRWIGPLARGERLAAFAMTEQEAGSDGRAVTACAKRDGDRYLLCGRKLWVTFGAVADVALVLACEDGRPLALLVPLDDPSVKREPVRSLVGLRASHTAHLDFRDTPSAVEDRVAKPGFGWSHVFAHALDFGRLSVAWGSVGVAAASRDLALSHASRRVQFGEPLVEKQLVQRMITDMVVGVEAARGLCLRAARAKADLRSKAMLHTMMAKHFAADVAGRAAADAARIHGAIAFDQDHPVARLLDDARVLGLIEGSREVLQSTIAQLATSGMMRDAETGDVE